MSLHGGRLPYPGLRSFTREETDLFFGREGSVDAMIDRLAATRFLAVLGASGSGKSSLVRTGLLDGLELGLLHSAGSRWVIADFRPGDAPIANMAEGLIRATAAGPGLPPDEDEIRLLRAFLARGPRSVVEWCDADNLPPGANLLLLVDQFEELFRYSEYAEREEAEAFVGLLLESARVPLDEARIYVAITMRSEYLGAAALIDGLAEAINRGLYLTPRMGRDQVREAIVGPAAVCGFSIEPALTNRLLNDLTSFAPWEEEDKGNQLERLVRRADQLPLMQHVLNRLWSLAAARGDAGSVVLKLEDYNALGGLRGALDAHGREILDELLPEHKEVASSVFRALTAGSSLAEAVRRPTEFRELVAIAGGDEIAVREVIEAFRAPGRNFLVPPRPAPLRATTVVDISHESLIRQWSQFANWLQQEIASAAAWRRLVDAAERYERGEANLLSGLALASLASWWDTEHPTAAWAKRYGGDFDRARAFLEQSRREEAAGKEAELQERRLKTRNRLITFAAIVILCIIVPLTVFAGYSALRANREAQTAELERQEAEAQRQDADNARQLAVAAAAAAEAERQIAAEERQRALAAEQDARQQAATAEAERRRAEAERQRALDAEKDARQQAEAAELERRRAEDERQLALTARQQAEAERQRALDAAARAETERQRADEERQHAMEAQAQAEAERQRAVELAAEARAERERAERQKQIADTERATRRLELIANRVASLQQSGAWDASANMLGALWQDLIEAGGAFQGSWLVEPIRASFQRQSLAEYPLFPDFLSYAGLEGWNGTTGRFRTYAVSATEAGGSDAPGGGQRIISVFDAMTGAVTGGFELPSGVDLGSELDLVTPDGRRAAIVLDNGELSLWAYDQEAPTFIPVPTAEGVEVDVAQLAPVATDDRFALYLTHDLSPGEIIVVDPAGREVTFRLAMQELALSIGVDSISSVQLLGLAGDQLVLLVNEPDGRLVTVGVPTKIVRELDVGGAVKGAQLTRDGRILLALACPGQCREQQLVATDLRANAALWVEKVPNGMAFTEGARIKAGEGAPVHTATVSQYGKAVTFRFSGTGAPLRFDGAFQAQIGEATYDGEGGFRSVVSADSDASGATLVPAGSLANFRIPQTRQKLSLYVAPNAVALHQGPDLVRIAGVDYSGNLLVYRLAADGTFEEDAAFRPVQIGSSTCLATLAFSGDGQSLLIRHVGGALQYVAAVGTGASVGWRIPAAGDAEASSVALAEGAPATSCDAAETPEDFLPERLVAVDSAGTTFALLDRQGTVWWVNIGEAAGEVVTSESAAPAPREIAPLQRAAAGMRWISGDPARRRIAAVAQPQGSAATLAPQETSATDAKGLAPSAGARDEPANPESGSGDALVILEPHAQATGSTTRGVSGSPRLPQRGEPKAVVFLGDGALVVAYAGGQLATLAGEDGVWSVKKEMSVPDVSITSFAGSAGYVALMDERDFVLAVDVGNGTLAGHGRLPALPSLIAMRDDGRVLSIEYSTDSVSTTALAAPPASGEINDTARLVAMRSRMEPVEDASIEALTLEKTMASAPSEVAATEIGCPERVALYLSILETRILGGAPDAAAGDPPACASAGQGGPKLAEVAELLATRAVDASIGELVRDESLSIILRLAAAGDREATRILGAALARISADRGQGTESELAREALRFGTGLSPRYLKAIAAGRPIDAALIEAVGGSQTLDPKTHQLLAHWYEREINDLDALGEALFEFSIAERLYGDSGRTAEAAFAGDRRAHLARVLPDDLVLEVRARLQNWRPQLQAADSGGVAEIPADPAARRAEDLQSLDRLAEQLPNSRLLEVLRTEFQRADILALAQSDPRAAVERLLAMGPRAGASWSPDLVGEYLDLAEDLRNADPESGFRLAAAALRLMTGAFQEPIHTNSEAVQLFQRSADQFAGMAEQAPRELVQTEAAEFDLRLANYQYRTLPAFDGQSENLAAETVLESAARVFAAIARGASEPERWNRLQAQALFWQGILTNNHDEERAFETLTASRDLLRPIVEQRPDDAELRFRYAELLRWIGLIKPSDAETAEIEREAIRHYEKAWQGRGALDSSLLATLGEGYGFALANLPETVRQLNLADLQDGRGAEDHAPWMLEALALAAEKEAVNAQMIEEGIAEADSEFVDGTYRMSSYGWALGFLGGLVNVESGTQDVTQCDVLASDPYDAGRRAPGLTLDQVDVAEAEPECLSAHEADAEDVRATYQLARVISSDASRSSEFLPLAGEAAAEGVAVASALIASTLQEKNDDRSAEAYMAAAQQVVIESFPVLYPFLEGHAAADRDRQGLAWYAREAADLGVPEAHFALAGSAPDDVTKQVHFRIAARLWDENGDAAAAENARQQANRLIVPVDRAEEVESRVAEWTPEALAEIPTEIGDI